MSATRVSRRELLSMSGALGVASVAGARPAAGSAGAERPLVRFGLVADVHYADRDPDPNLWGEGSRRFYREARRRLEEAVGQFNAHGMDFAIELGDIKDMGKDKAATVAALAEIERTFAGFRGPRYHVCGNHDFDCLTEAEFFSSVQNDGRPMERGHYAFSARGVRFVVLDACYDSSFRHYSRNNPWEDANVPPDQLAWLKDELKRASAPVVAFCHQRLDPSAESRHLVRNAGKVRAILEASGKVRTVFTGHQHNGGIGECNGIDYYSLRAMACRGEKGANSYAEVSVFGDGTVSVLGYRRAVSFVSRGICPQTGSRA